MGILCTSGSYCPPRSISPILANPGYYTSGLGNVRQQPCEPGTYNNQYGATSCILCPVGQFCGAEGMVEANIIPCQAGSYRSDNTTIYCTNCPEGTYSGLTGAISKDNCTACDEGYVCNKEGLTRIEEATLCP